MKFASVLCLECLVSLERSRLIFGMTLKSLHKITWPFRIEETFFQIFFLGKILA